MCRHSRSAVEHWLIVVMQPNAHLLGLIVSGVRVCVSFKIISRVVCRLGSEVRVSASFQGFVLLYECLSVASRFFAVPSAVLCARKVIFLSSSSRHVLGIPHNGAVVRRCVFSTDPLMVVHLVQRRWAWAGLQPAHTNPRCAKSE